MIKKSSRPKGRELLEGVDDLLYRERPCPHPSRRPPPHFNSRSPCGERPAVYTDAKVAKEFQPTLPVRGATSIVFPANVLWTISTHAPPAGSDCKSAQIFLKKQVLLPINSCFYSRSRTAAAKNYSLAGSNLAPVRVRTPTRYCDRFRFAVKE